MTGQLEITGRIEALALQPGDVLVVHCQKPLSHEQESMLSRFVQSRIPGHNVLVMSGGLDLCVVRKEAA